MNHKYLILLCIFKSAVGACVMLFTLGCSNAQTANSARAVALKAAPATVVSEAQIAMWCARLSTPCHAQTTSAWVGDALPLGRLFLIDRARPMLMAVRDGQIVQHWDFGAFAHSRSASKAEPGEPLEIYPALYPAGDGHYAVAIVHHRREGYSGGGALFSLADFVPLAAPPKTADAKAAPPLYASVPFSCSKMVRACFSERESQTSRHCHDETEGYLTIQFPARNTPKQDWTFTWHETQWPAHVTKAHARRTQTRFTLPARATSTEALPKNVSFCGGPQ